MYDNWILRSSDFQMNPKSPLLAEKSHKNSKNLWKTASHQSHAHPERFLTALQNHRAGSQVDRRWLENVYFVRRCSQVCLASLSQAMRRLHAGVRSSRNRHQLSQVYLICIVGVSQVYLKCTATRSQPSRTWISVHTIECTHDSKIWFRLAHYQRLFDGVSSEYKTLLYEISLLR